MPSALACAHIHLIVCACMCVDVVDTDYTMALCTCGAVYPCMCGLCVHMYVHIVHGLCVYVFHVCMQVPMWVVSLHVYMSKYSVCIVSVCSQACADNMCKGMDSVSVCIRMHVQAVCVQCGHV